MTQPNTGKDDGGPAFPCPIDVIPGNAGLIFTREYSDTPQGMSLRDHFAGQAMMGLLAMELETICQSTEPEAVERERQQFANEIAVSAYRYADAMISARKGDQ